MTPGAFKSLLTAMVTQPLALLLLAASGLMLALASGASTRWTGLVLLALSLGALALLSCHGCAVWLARKALPQFAPLLPEQLTIQRVQAIVVLGGGVLPTAPEYGQAQPSAVTAARLRYGLWLARQSGLPVAFSGGLGWGANGMQRASEAEVASRVALQEHGVTLRWTEGQSKDTTENAERLAPLLQASDVTRIALVTHATHMPRSVVAFTGAGFIVTPAPTGFVKPLRNTVLEWLPSAEGLQASQHVLLEVVFGFAARWQQH
ncbi:MAG: YdcF family protein [Polaromonas sp.]|nr:YdcF family protein [Polaromonas sp.]